MSKERTTSTASASEGTGGLEIGPIRDDERFGEYVYRHEKVHGIVYPPGLTEERMDLFKDQFQGRSTDVYIVTFPKSGTTWTQQVLHLLQNKGEQGDVPLIRAIPWVERVIAAGGEEGVKEIENMPSPRFFKSHSPVHLFPKAEEGAKIVVVGRNPKDTMVSMFHHAKSKVEFEFNGDWKDWYRIFLDGNCESGDWFEYTLGWWNESQTKDNVMFFTYEEMKRDPKAMIGRLATFCDIEADENLIDLVVEGSSFNAMKSNTLTNCEQIPQRGEPHLRKGQVGDWRNYFTVAQNDAFNALYDELMAGSGLDFEFYPPHEIDEEESKDS